MMMITYTKLGVLWSLIFALTFANDNGENLTDPSYADDLDVKEVIRRFWLEMRELLQEQDRKIDTKMEQYHAELSNTRKVLLDSFYKGIDKILSSPTQDELRKFLEQKEKRSANGANCKELLDKGMTKSGVYTIFPNGLREGVEVFCDQVTDGGGWTVFLQRQQQPDQVDFSRTFEDYAAGFGDPEGEIWIGNRVLHSMTGDEPFVLRVDADNLQGESRTGIWDIFSVGSEDTQFTLSVANYSTSSSLGDGLWRTVVAIDSSENMKFSTVDQRNYPYRSYRWCSEEFGKGGWWYNICHGANPTAPLGHDNDVENAHWVYWEPTNRGWESTHSVTAISKIQFMIRPHPK